MRKTDALEIAVFAVEQLIRPTEEVSVDFIVTEFGTVVEIQIETSERK